MKRRKLNWEKGGKGMVEFTYWQFILCSLILGCGGVLGFKMMEWALERRDRRKGERK